MFVAKFSATSGAPFVADKNGTFPMIGEVLAGTATGSIINGTMFQRDGLVPNKLYACENVIDPEYPDNVQTKVISEVSVLEYMSLRTTLGAGKVVIAEDAEEEVEEAVEAEENLAPKETAKKATTAK